jgi:hypothetical protein
MNPKERRHLSRQRGQRVVAKGQHVLPSLVHQLSGFGKALDQRGGQVIPPADDLAGVLLGEHTAQGSGDYALVGYVDALQQFPSEMNATALPDATLQLPADRLGEPQVGVGDHHFGPSEATLFEQGKKLTPEALSLTVVLLEAQHSRRPSTLTPMATSTARKQTCRALPSRPLR